MREEIKKKPKTKTESSRICPWNRLFISIFSRTNFIYSQSFLDMYIFKLYADLRCINMTFVLRLSIRNRRASFHFAGVLFDDGKWKLLKEARMNLSNPFYWVLRRSDIWLSICRSFTFRILFRAEAHLGFLIVWFSSWFRFLGRFRR